MGKKIMLVDDAAFMRMTIKNCLTRQVTRIWLKQGTANRRWKLTKKSILI